jgi:hypothetical protein
VIIAKEYLMKAMQCLMMVFAVALIAKAKMFTML